MSDSVVYAFGRPASHVKTLVSQLSGLPIDKMSDEQLQSLTPKNLVDGFIHESLMVAIFKHNADAVIKSVLEQTSDVPETFMRVLKTPLGLAVREFVPETNDFCHYFVGQMYDECEPDFICHDLNAWHGDNDVVATLCNYVPLCPSVEHYAGLELLISYGIPFDTFDFLTKFDADSTPVLLLQMPTDPKNYPYSRFVRMSDDGDGKPMVFNGKLMVLGAKINIFGDGDHQDYIKQHQSADFEFLPISFEALTLNGLA